MKPHLLDRRKEILSYHTKGIPTKKWVPILAQKYGVKVNAIYVDYKRMDAWIGEILTLKDSEHIADMVLLNLQEALNAAWKEHNEAQLSGARLRALELISVLATKFLELSQSLGRVEKKAEKADVTIRQPSNALRDLLRALLVETEEDEDEFQTILKAFDAE